MQCDNEMLTNAFSRILQPQEFFLLTFVENFVGWRWLVQSRCKSYICKTEIKKMSFYRALQSFHNIPVPQLLHLLHLLQVE